MYMPYAKALSKYRYVRTYITVIIHAFIIHTLVLCDNRIFVIIEFKHSRDNKIFIIVLS